MTVARLLLDEMLSARITERLSAHGLDAQAFLERRDLVGAPDEALLELASREGRILVSKNVLDFAPMSQQWTADGRRHGGLVLVSTRTFPETRDWVTAVTTALAQAHEQGRLPGPEEVLWLRR